MVVPGRARPAVWGIVEEQGQRTVELHGAMGRIYRRKRGITRATGGSTSSMRDLEVILTERNPQTSSCQQCGEEKSFGCWELGAGCTGESPEEEKGNPELANTNRQQTGDNEGR